MHVAGRLKHKRRFQTDEYEVSSTAESITIPVPQAMRGRKAIIVVSYE